MSHVFLLGAGFTRAVLGSKAPLTDEIMPKLNLSGFPEIIEDYERTFPDIEQFITQLDLRCLRLANNNVSLSGRLNEIRANIIEQIVTFFDVSALSVDSLDSCLLLKKFTESVPAHSIILTLNYDCVLDQGLWLNKKWSPKGGYYASSFPVSNDDNRKLDNILLLKLHGSCNFRDDREDTEYPSIEITPNIFHGIHTHSNERTMGSRAHVLVMSYLKRYHNGIMLLWRTAIEALRDAERLTIVGCSLREEDIFLKFALYHFGMKENIKRFNIDVIDIGEENCRRIESKLIKLVARPDQQKINTYKTGLEEYLETCPN